MRSRKCLTGIKILIAWLFLAVAPRSVAQSYIDEDFLDNLGVNARFMLNETDPFFSVNNTPPKWDKESAVIIGYSRSVVFDRKSSGGFFTKKEKSLYFFEKNRLKIKLNDNNSVKAFSEIYFRYGSKEDGFIARIIKPGDTAITIDLKNAVGIESGSEVPEFFQSYFDQVAYSTYKYYKVPVANLEPGDILEYVTTTKSRLDVSTSGYIEFRPNYEVCSKKYPVMHNEIIIETDDKSYFKSLSLNGAPKFRKEISRENNFMRFVFTDKNRETEKDVNFVSPLLHYPLVKFQVIYSNNDQVKGALIGIKGELKSEFTREELARKAWEEYETVGNVPLTGKWFFSVQNFINECWSELVKLGAKSWPEQQYIDQAYYLVRNKILFQSEYLSDKKFAYIFGSLLYQRDIKSELVISIANNVGQLKEVLFDQEIRYTIKVGDRLFFNLTDYSNPGDLEESLLDNEAYIIYQPVKKSGQQEIKQFTLPGTKAEENYAGYSISAEMSPDMTSLNVSRTSNYKGIQKAKAVVNALKYTTYIFDDYKNYGGSDPTIRMKSKEAEEYHTNLRTVKEEYKKQKPDFVKESLESEFDQKVNNVRFNLISDGRTKKKSTLSYKEEFELSGIVRKAGKKYLVNLVGLAGSQLQIKKEERDRTHDIDVRYPRTFSWDIQFRIPQGYAVEGLAELNKTVENETGGLTLSAREENGFVLINMKKVYKEKTIPRVKWNNMLAFLDAAYNSSFKYVLLKPIQ